MAIAYRDDAHEDDGLIAQINTTPLVDVMLVLLMIFLITIPVVNSAVFVTLPRESGAAPLRGAETIVLTVDAQGTLYWFDTRLAGPAELDALLARAAALDPQPQVQVRGDARGGFEPVGRVIGAAQSAGFARVGLLTQPPP